MFEAVSVTSCDIQREIISCIPEVIDDMQHVDVAHKLKLVQNESGKVVTICSVVP